MPARILIADDQTDILEALRLLLKGEGYETTAVTSPDAVQRAVEQGDFDLVLLDLNYTRDTTSEERDWTCCGPCASWTKRCRWSP